jgi:hypothetical protein
MTPWFIATKRFDAGFGDDWTRYVAWSGLTQLEELVSLDSMLCPCLLHEIRDHYWPHIVNEDFMLNYFTDLDFMLAELPASLDWSQTNLLCVFRNPPAEPPPALVPFPAELVGYDLCDVYGGNSALSNCGGFPLAFDSAELSRHGLIRSHERAAAVRDALMHHYPDEVHAKCHLWAIYRRIERSA